MDLYIQHPDCQRYLIFVHRPLAQSGVPTLLLDSGLYCCCHDKISLIFLIDQQFSFQSIIVWTEIFQDGKRCYRSSAFLTLLELRLMKIGFTFFSRKLGIRS